MVWNNHSNNNNRVIIKDRIKNAVLLIVNLKLVVKMKRKKSNGRLKMSVQRLNNSLLRVNSKLRSLNNRHHNLSNKLDNINRESNRLINAILISNLMRLLDYIKRLMKLSHKILFLLIIKLLAILSKRTISKP